MPCAALSLYANCRQRIRDRKNRRHRARGEHDDSDQGRRSRGVRCPAGRRGKRAGASIHRRRCKSVQRQKGTPQEQAACHPDATKHCRAAGDDELRVLACLQQNRARSDRRLPPRAGEPRAINIRRPAWDFHEQESRPCVRVRQLFLRPLPHRRRRRSNCAPSCKDAPLQQRLIAQAREGLERQTLVLELETRCAQIDLPATPVHDAADTSPAAAHSDWVFDARYSRDGRTILSAGRGGHDTHVGRRDRQAAPPHRRGAGRPRAGPGQEGIVRAATFVGDETRAAAASDRNPVRVIELATGKIAASFPSCPTALAAPSRRRKAASCFSATTPTPCAPST